MIDYAESLRIIAQEASMLAVDTIPACDCIGRVCAESVASGETVAPFATSAMDGFALRSSELNQKTFTVLGTIAAGDAPLTTDSGSGIWEIMTGASIPKGYDTVVKVEDTRTLALGQVEVLRSPHSFENVRPAGEDFQEGQLILPKGTRVQPQHLLALATVGVSQLKVYRAPHIAILSTGNELVSYSTQALPPGSIRNSTAPFLCVELRALGAEVKYYGIVSDKPEDFLPLLSSILGSTPDILITTGAVSMGKYDFIATALRDLGAEIYFHKVAIRPGKPILFGRLKGTALFGLPGNPISSTVGVRFFVEPYLRAAREESAETVWELRLKDAVKKPAGLRCFFKAAIHNLQGEWEIESLPGQSSALVSPLLRANAWVVLPSEPEHLEKGTIVQAFPLHSWGGFQ